MLCLIAFGATVSAFVPSPPAAARAARPHDLAWTPPRYSAELGVGLSMTAPPNASRQRRRGAARLAARWSRDTRRGAGAVGSADGDEEHAAAAVSANSGRRFEKGAENEVGYDAGIDQDGEPGDVVLARYSATTGLVNRAPGAAQPMDVGADESGMRVSPREEELVRRLAVLKQVSVSVVAKCADNPPAFAPIAGRHSVLVFGIALATAPTFARAGGPRVLAGHVKLQPPAKTSTRGTARTHHARHQSLTNSPRSLP